MKFISSLKRAIHILTATKSWTTILVERIFGTYPHLPGKRVSVVSIFSKTQACSSIPIMINDKTPDLMTGSRPLSPTEDRVKGIYVFLIVVLFHEFENQKIIASLCSVDNVSKKGAKKAEKAAIKEAKKVSRVGEHQVRR